jgi:hypothetical protein
VSAHVVVDAVRVGWLTLAFMMLLSRIVFQAAGPARMRAFLDGWQRRGVKRVWGSVSLLFAAFLVVAAATHDGPLRALDIVLLVTLLLLLAADGLVNAVPGGFAAFKDRVQEAWVARHRGTGREGDRHLFGTVNAALAVAAAAVAAVVIAYRPIATSTLVLAAALAFVLTAGLIAASTLRR